MNYLELNAEQTSALVLAIQCELHIRHDDFDLSRKQDGELLVLLRDLRDRPGYGSEDPDLPDGLVIPEPVKEVVITAQTYELWLDPSIGSTQVFHFLHSGEPPFNAFFTEPFTHGKLYKAKWTAGQDYAGVIERHLEGYQAIDDATVTGRGTEADPFIITIMNAVGFDGVLSVVGNKGDTSVLSKLNFSEQVVDAGTEDNDDQTDDQDDNSDDQGNNEPTPLERLVDLANRPPEQTAPTAADRFDEHKDKAASDNNVGTLDAGDVRELESNTKEGDVISTWSLDLIDNEDAGDGFFYLTFDDDRTADLAPDISNASLDIAIESLDGVTEAEVTGEVGDWTIVIHATEKHPLGLADAYLAHDSQLDYIA